MKQCNVIQDLLPLYIDGCCSKESVHMVEKHMEECPACRAVHESMCIPARKASAPAAAPAKLSRINDWKASVLQSVLMFLAFGLITVGVALEAATPYGLGNGSWALWLVMPAAGLLLSLPNWYFVRLYRSKQAFSTCSCLITLSITLCAYIWASIHYEVGLSFVFSVPGMLYYGPGLLLTAVFCLASKILSGRYALLLGKE